MNQSMDELRNERDYWKNRFDKYRADVEFFVGGTMLLFLIILAEYIITHYIEVPIGK